MTNHVHLLMKFPTKENFRKVPQRLNLLYAKYFSRENHYVGHVFQDRFKSFAVTDNSYLLECGRYIERNPLKAGLVKDPSEYQWSSCSYYVEGVNRSFLTPNPLFLDLASTSQERKETYKSFVCTQRAYDAVIQRTIFGWRSL
jgi:putative transposase